jgi:hypothetical protein
MTADAIGERCRAILDGALRQQGETMTIDDLFTGPSFNTEQKLSDGGLTPLADLIVLLRLGHRFAGNAAFGGADPIIQSPHRLGKVSGIAQLLIGVSGAAIWQARITCDQCLDRYYRRPALPSPDAFRRAKGPRNQCRRQNCHRERYVSMS